jgi:hypothetical protein
MKKNHPLTDLDKMPIKGPHHGQKMRNIPALYLLSLIGDPVLDDHPSVKAYIDRAIRQLRAEAKREIEEKHHRHD